MWGRTVFLGNRFYRQVAAHSALGAVRPWSPGWSHALSLVPRDNRADVVSAPILHDCATGRLWAFQPLLSTFDERFVVLDDLFGLRPPSWVLVPHVVETMQHLAQTGHVILIGRGATIVTARWPNVFHVRLVASLPTRISRIQASHSLTAEEAMRFVGREDRGRQRYVRTHFHVQLDDALLYHIVSPSMTRQR